MLTSSALYKSVIHRPDQRVFRVDLYSGDTGTLLERGLPIFGGSITANLDNRVTRSGDFTVGAEWWPGTSPTAALTPYQTVAKVYAGARYGDGSEELFQLIEGRVGSVTRAQDGTVSARIDDRAADVVGVQFENPRNSENIPIYLQVRRLISEALPTAVFGPDDVDTTAMTPKLTWEENRGDALDTLAGALGARWYQLGNGSFVQRVMPYDAGTSVATISDGEDGLLTDASITITRDGAANSVTLLVERADGGAPIRVRARDTSTTSPTSVSGPFGLVTKIVKVQTPLTNGQATTAVRAQLQAATALSSQWAARCQADYTLEPGDTVLLSSRGETSRQLIDRIRYPLDSSPMDLGTRAYVRAPATIA